MKKTILATVLAAFSGSLYAQSISSTYFIGDSLTDSGQLGSRFTTNPGKVWSDYLAERLGTDATPSSQGGTNFAVGGARVAVDTLADPSQPAGPLNPVLPSMATQLNQLLAITGGRLNSNALYSVWGGANDLLAITEDPANAAAILGESVINQVDIVNALHEHGARYVLVGDIPNLGQTPSFSSDPATQMMAGALSEAYNQSLANALQTSDANIIPLNMSGLLSAAIADPAKYGFSNVTDTACTTSALQCGPDQLVTPDAALTYLYADDVHPSARAHEIIASYTDSVVSAGSAVSVVGMTANQAGLAQMQSIDRRLATVGVEPGLQLWIEGGGVFSSSSHKASKIDGNNGASRIGANLQINQWTLGSYLHYDRTDSRVRSVHDMQQKRFAGGFYGRWTGANAWVNAQVYWADLDTEFKRSLQLGPAQIKHQSKSGGHQAGGRVSAGYNWQYGNITHGPLVGLNLQRAKVGKLKESEADGFSAMRFDAQSQKSVQSSLGYQLSVAVNPIWSVYGSGQWLHEFKKADKTLRAGMQTGNYTNRSFYLPTEAKLAKNTGAFELGATGRLSKEWDLNAGVSLQTGNAANSQSAVYLGAAYRF